jgi:putative ABC transport system permease protein
VIDLKLWDVMGISANGVKERKFRFALNLIGILIGCAAVTGLVSMTQGMSNTITDQLGSLGASTITVIPGSFTGGHGFTGGGSFVTRTLGWMDLNTIEKIPDVEFAVPIESGGSGAYMVKGKTYFRSLTGVTEQYFAVNKALEIEEGRALLRSDLSVAVIGYDVFQPPTEDEPILRLGDRLRVTTSVGGVDKELTLRIVGVLKKTGGSFGSSDSVILIPLKTYEQFFETAGAYNSIQVAVTSTDKVDAVAQAIKAKVDQVTVVTAASAQSMVNTILGTIQAVLGGIAAISLVVAGVGIINTMTISVLERTREIGTLKALGAKSRDILFMFLSEAMLTGVVGGLIGAFGGFGLSVAVGNYIRLAPDLSFSLGALVVGFAVVTCVLSGLYPAWHASRMNPVEALRYE